MSSVAKWDTTSTHSLEAFAGFVAKKTGASAVLIVRGGDYAFVAGDGVRAEDAREAVEFVLPDATEDLERRQQRAREAATRKRAAAIAEQVSNSTGKG